MLVMQIPTEQNQRNRSLIINDVSIVAYNLSRCNQGHKHGPGIATAISCSHYFIKRYRQEKTNGQETEWLSTSRFASSTIHLTISYNAICMFGNMINVTLLPLQLQWRQSLQWRPNDRDGVPTHWRLSGLLNRLFRRRSKKTTNLRVNGLSDGNSPVTDEFPSQRASNAENASIWWRHHDNYF